MRENLLGAIVLILGIGLVMGWKWEGLGSFLVFGGLVLFAIVDRGLLLGIVIMPWLVTGLLYLVCWWMRSVKKGAAEDSAIVESVS